MRLIRSLALLALVTPLASGCLGSGSSINAYGGTRSLDTDDFGSLDDQTVYGADLVLKTSLPFTAVEGGFFHADESDDTAGLNNAELSSEDYFVGLRITPWNFLISPYASVGVTYLDSSLDATGVSDSDSDLAYYLRVGAAVSFAMLRVGVDGRALTGTDVDLDTIESDLDSYQFTIFLGLGF